MGRLQRKKDVNKKKKNKQGVSGSGSSQESNDSKKKASLITGISKAAKNGQALSQKKPMNVSRSAGKDHGNSFIDKGMQFLREVKIEFKKVTWPSRKQTIGSTVVVIILVMIISAFLGLVDFGLGNMVSAVLH